MISPHPMHLRPFLVSSLVALVALAGASAAPAAGRRSAEPGAAPAPLAASPQRGGGGRIRVRGSGGGRPQGGNRGAGRTAGRDEPPEMPPEELERAKVYFRASDRDGNGWISLAEAQAALELDRRRFSQFDRNQDGRITPGEFERAYRKTWERIGAFKPPIVEPGSEGERLLAELAGRAAEEGAPAGEGEEEDLGHDVLPPEERARSIAELFGRPEPRDLGEDAPPAPPRVRGPVPIFLRLDIDRDGGITARDLDELSRPLQLPVRGNTVLAMLDRDENGRVDAAELALALGADPR